MRDESWRTEHVGSLLRTPALIGLRMALLQGKGDPESLRAAEDEAILRALRRQEDLGLDVVGDGEFRRFSFMGEVAAAVDGFAFGELPNPDWFTGEGTANPGAKAMLVVAPLMPRRRIAAHEGALARRVEEASRFVPLDRLAISPQCGFATSVPGNRLAEDEQWEKLHLLVAVARKIWS